MLKCSLEDAKTSEKEVLMLDTELKERYIVLNKNSKFEDRKIAILERKR